MKNIYYRKLIGELWRDFDIFDDIIEYLFWLRLDNIIEVEEIDFYYRCVEKGINQRSW